MAITDKPIADSEIPKNSDILMALKTVISAPCNVIKNERNITGIPTVTGDFEIFSLSQFFFSITSLSSDS